MSTNSAVRAARAAGDAPANQLAEAIPRHDESSWAARSGPAGIEETAAGASANRERGEPLDSLASRRERVGKLAGHGDGVTRGGADPSPSRRQRIAPAARGPGAAERRPGLASTMRPSSARAAFRWAPPTSHPITLRMLPIRTPAP